MRGGEERKKQRENTSQQHSGLPINLQKEKKQNGEITTTNKRDMHITAVTSLENTVHENTRCI